MTYLDFINLFNRYDREKRFSDGASRLYIKLLDVTNEVNRSRPKNTPWLVDFQRSDGYMAGVCGWSVNTLKKHREELQKRELVSGDFGQVGRNGTGKYHLRYPENLSTSDTFSAANLSNIDKFPEQNLSDIDTFNPENPSTSDTFSPENELNLSGNLSNVDTLYIERRNKESSGAAVAASPPAAFSESFPTPAASPAKPAGRKPKAKGATHADIAALPLPFDGDEFAEAWRTFSTTNTKQAGKAITAFELMLKKLGKYPEAFAVLMLERAIMGNWQGVENSGTPRDFVEWQAQQARQPSPPPAASSSAAPPTPGRNEEFIAEQQRQQQAAQNARFDRYAAQAQPEPALAA